MADQGSRVEVAQIIHMCQADSPDECVGPSPADYERADAVLSRWLVLNPRDESLVERIARTLAARQARDWDLLTTFEHGWRLNEARVVLAALAGDSNG